MAELHQIVKYLDEYLRISSVVDYPGAYNGLQLENGGKVTHIGAAVDASEAVIEKAAAQGVTLLLVHHGMYWTPQTLTGAMYRKVRAAMDAGLAIYSSHLPLDLHPQVGNNAELCRAIGLRSGEPFLFLKGQAAGLQCEAAMPVAELVRKLETALGCRPHVCPGGPAITRRIGVVTGGAGSEVARAAAEGVDTFITGEGPHWSYGMAEELGLNVIYGGHYATETFGVKALAHHLSAQYGIPWEFIDHPTGL